MPSPQEYIHCDELENLPPLCRENYLYEREELVKLLPHGVTVLQVGSMDGMRAMRLLEARPDLQYTGLDVEEELVQLAHSNTAQVTPLPEFVLGDITDPPNLSHFDYVLCLNNTLGYIPEQQRAVDAMKKLGRHVFISVFGEKFTDELARQYFTSIGVPIQDIHNDTFHMQGSWDVRRYTKEEVKKWHGKVSETPLGYIMVLSS